MKVRCLELPNYPTLYTLEDFYSENELESILEESQTANSFRDFNLDFSWKEGEKPDYIPSPGDRHISNIETTTESRTKVQKLWETYRPSRCVPIDSYNTDFKERLQIVSPDYNYPVHTDAYWKAMTIIIYLEGEQGTVFTGNENDQDGIEIEFRQNCGYMFFPDGMTTWHYFKNLTDKPRSTSIIHKILNLPTDEEYKDLLGYTAENTTSRTRTEFPTPDLVKIDFTEEYNEIRIPSI